MAKKFNPLIPLMLDEVGMTAQEKAELNSKMENDGSNYISDKPLIVPVLTALWSIRKQDNSAVGTSTSASLVLENGAVLYLSAQMVWTSQQGYKDATSMSGFWGTNLPNSGVSISKTEDNIKTNKTFTCSLMANKSGLIVISNKVQKASGEDTSSASLSVAFKHRRYWGTSLETSLTDEQVKELSTELTTSRNQTAIFDCTGGKYFYFAIPTTLCSGIKFTIGGLTNTDFTLDTRNITNEYGLVVSYNIYHINNIQNGSSIQVVVS